MDNNILWVDDIRNPPDDLICDIARTYQEAVDLLTQNNYNTIYLDHDLGDFTENGIEFTGYKLVLWIVQRKMDGHLVPTRYEFLTSNPVGRRNMQAVIHRWMLDERY